MRILGQFFYPSNQLTLLRLVFIPFLVLSILYGQHRSAFILVLIAGISDGMDGVIARYLGQQTTLGRYLDPIADKLLLTAAFLALGVAGDIPIWVVILVLSRDVIILMISLVLILTSSRGTFPPTLFGKISTIFQVATVLVVLLHHLNAYQLIGTLKIIGIYCTAAFTIISGVQYAWVTAEQLRRSESVVAKVTPVVGEKEKK